MIYQFKITLKGIEPPIWRSLLVDPTMAMDELHYVIQSVMGWDSEYEYQFSSGKRKIIDPEVEGEEDDEFAPDILIGQAFRKAGDKWLYLYDFEDNWEHEIVLEKIVEMEPGVEYPVCTDGARACPFEGCGGTVSYLNLLAILKNPKDPGYAELKESLGDFDPEEFDKDLVNEELHDPENWVDEDEDDDEAN
ncbi:MAG TPA: plasmid pRiA4b ORF-3 family protein [Bacteroidia bacterium]|nr:plasmid pRiA4b ORF-3 family protein [Bacteroidia bacterium]